MAISNPQRTVSVDGYAMGTLQFIRSSIDGAAHFHVPGLAGIAMGGIGLSAYLLASMHPLSKYQLSIWIAASVVAASIGSYLMIQRAHGQQAAVHRGPLMRFAGALCPGLLAGLALTATFIRTEAAEYLPGIWLLLYGASVLSASSVASLVAGKIVKSMAVCFIALGVVALETHSDGLHNLFLGLGFGGLHLGAGMLLARKGYVE